MPDETRIRSSSEVGEADWIGPRLGPFAERIDSLVPGGFEAYARVFHPAHGPRGRRASWAEIASWAGKTMHPHAEFEQIARRTRGEAGGRTHGCEPRVGELEPDLVGVLAALLARHTGTPERCWFCIWDGGWVNGAGAVLLAAAAPEAKRRELRREWEASWQLSFGREALEAPRVRLPGRDYVLVEGPLEAVGELGERREWEGRSRFEPHSPNLWWPDDRAWCVATDIDLDSTHVGGSGALVEELLAEPRLEALRVDGSDARGDRLNATR